MDRVMTPAIDWQQRLRRMMDEPWYDSSAKALPRITELSEIIGDILGPEHCAFEVFDLMHQVGILYTNPATGRRHAVRLKWDDDHRTILDAMRELRRKTA